jgi:thiamine kinase-like enzyme
MKLRPEGNIEIENAVRAALGKEGVGAELTQVGLKGNVSILYRYGDNGVAKTVLRGSPPVFWANHEREMDFYRRTKRYPCRDVKSDVILMDFLVDGEVPDQVAGLTVDQLKRILLTASTLHRDLTPWSGMERASSVVLALGYDMAKPLLDRVTEERVRELQLCEGREREAVFLMRAVMNDWQAIVDDLSGDTVIHGDLRGENVFLPFDCSREAVLFDWQLVSVGSPFVDLAYLLAGSLTVADRAKHEMLLLESYCDCPCGEQFLARYRRAQRWPVVWAVFVCGGGMDHVDKSSDVWKYQRIVTERFLQAAMGTTNVRSE